VTSAPSAPEIRAAVDQASWYHTLELCDGIVTPGEYDLRALPARLPIPDSLAGRRCLDVGTRDGFWAFDMERRGAGEVVGIDIGDPRRLDWPLPIPAAFDDGVAEELARRDRAFDIAHRALGSRVEWRDLSVYDLSAEEHGTFDFAFLGTLLLHLRDPVGALAAIRGVMADGGTLLVNEPISLVLTALRRGPAANLLTLSEPFWWLPNRQALSRYVEAAGFRIVDRGRPYLVDVGARPNLARFSLGTVKQRLLLGGRRVPHAWVLATPR